MKAVEILKRGDEYKSILQGRSGSILITREDNAIMSVFRYGSGHGDDVNV